MEETCTCPTEAGSATCERKPDSAPTPARAENTCPVNGQKGKSVQNQTVKGLLKTSLRTVHETARYFFCAAADCPVVYFSADGMQIFRRDAIRELVYQKDRANSAVLVCYCFQHTLGTIQDATSEQEQVILNDIKQGIADGQCACDIRNPQGSCCLGNVMGLVKRPDGSKNIPNGATA